MIIQGYNLINKLELMLAMRILSLLLEETLKERQLIKKWLSIFQRHTNRQSLQ